MSTRHTQTSHASAPGRPRATRGAGASWSGAVPHGLAMPLTGHIRRSAEACHGLAWTGAQERLLGGGWLHAQDLTDAHAILARVAFHAGASVDSFLGVHPEADHLAAHLF